MKSEKIKSKRPVRLSDLRAMFIITWHEEGSWDLLKVLKKHLGRLLLVMPGEPKNRLFKSIYTAFTEFFLAVEAFQKRKEFHVVFSWSMRTGIIYGLINRFFSFLSAPVHVLRDFHINCIRKDPAYRLKLMVLRLALPGIDYFLCTSKREEQIYSEIFSIPKDRILFFPDTPSCDLFEHPPTKQEDYIFSYGNSDRDFDSLVKAAMTVKKPVLIVSQAFDPEYDLPAYISLVRQRISYARLMELISSARMVVLPHEHFQVAAGQNTMIETMALGRPLIVAANFATIEYAKNLETAFFYWPGDVNHLASLIELLWDHPEIAEKVAKRAKQTAYAYPAEEDLILLKFLADIFSLDKDEKIFENRLVYFR